MQPVSTDPKPTTGGALDSALLSELSAADREAAQLGQPVPEGALSAPPPPPTQAQELAAILQVLGQAAGMVFPSVAPIYTPVRCQATADAVAPALEKLGIRLPTGAAGVYLPAAAAVLTLAWETREAVLRDLARMRAERERETREAKNREAAASEPKRPAPAPLPTAQQGNGQADEAAVLRPPVVL